MTRSVVRGRRYGPVGVFAVAVTLIALATGTATAGTGTTATRVSVASDGTQGNNNSIWPSVSDDGRHVAFQSTASNLVPGDTNGAYDVFVRDTVEGTITRVSVANDGAQADAAGAGPSISGDGRYIAFESAASNLVAGDTNGSSDVFVRDIVGGTTTRVSVADDGTEGDSSSGRPSVSRDGRYIAFRSDASNLVPGDTNDSVDVFVRDTVEATTTRVTVADDGTEGDNSSWDPSISGDGQHIAFWSVASNLVAGDTNGDWDVFVRDTVGRTTTRVSVADDGTEGDNTSFGPSVSDDGRYIAFQSAASNLVAGDTNGILDVFVRDTVEATTTRVSVADDGTQSNNFSDRPSITGDGRYIAFASAASNLVPGDTNGHQDVFVHDTAENTLTLVSAADGTQANGFNARAAVTRDGPHIAFDSAASNLVPGDTNGHFDVFVYDRRTVDATPATISTPAVTPDPAPVASAVTVTADVDDSANGGSDIASGDYRWRADGSASWSSWTPLVAADGALDGPTETLEASIGDGFPSAGVYEVCVRATDTAGNTSEGTSCAFVAVYDPAAGFTVGSGSVDSPAPADPVNGASGPASFTFVSKYAKGKTTPDGGLQFHFRDGDLAFRSTSQSWLVVTGEPRARFQGTGVLNNVQTCQFSVEAWDGSHSSGGDAFGLRIFECGGGNEARYDLDPQALTRGDIKVKQQ